MPQELRAAYEEEEHYPKVTVRGTGYFGGMEYMFKRDRAALDKYPHTCAPIDIPSGEYAATIFDTRVTDRFEKSWLRERAGAGARRITLLHHLVSAGAVITLIVS